MAAVLVITYKSTLQKCRSGKKSYAAHYTQGERQER
jgi:hypothetical protein